MIRYDTGAVSQAVSLPHDGIASTNACLLIIPSHGMAVTAGSKSHRCRQRAVKCDGWRTTHQRSGWDGLQLPQPESDQHRCFPSEIGLFPSVVAAIDGGGDDAGIWLHSSGSPISVKLLRIRAGDLLASTAL